MKNYFLIMMYFVFYFFICFFFFLLPQHGDKVILIKGIDGVRGSTNTMQVAVVAE